MKTFCIYLTKIKYYKQLKVSVYPSPLWRNTFCPKSGLYYFSEMSLCWYMYVFLGNKYYYFHVFRFWHKWYHECTYSSTAWFLYFTLSKRAIFSVWVNHNLYIHSLVDRCLSYFQNFNYWKCCSEHSYMWALALRSTNFCVPVLSVVREVDQATGVIGTFSASLGIIDCSPMIMIIFTYSVWEFLLLYVLINTWLYQALGCLPVWCVWNKFEFL